MEARFSCWLCLRVYNFFSYPLGSIIFSYPTVTDISTHLATAGWLAGGCEHNRRSPADWASPPTTATTAFSTATRISGGAPSKNPCVNSSTLCAAQGVRIVRPRDGVVNLRDSPRRLTPPFPLHEPHLWHCAPGPLMQSTLTVGRRIDNHLLTRLHREGRTRLRRAGRVDRHRRWLAGLQQPNRIGEQPLLCAPL